MADEELVRLVISEADLGRARSRSIVGRRVAIPDYHLGQSRKRIGKVPFQFLLLSQRLSSERNPQRAPSSSIGLRAGTSRTRQCELRT